MALASSVVQAGVASVGGGREAFEVAPPAQIDHQANVASTGWVSGYRFHLPGYDDGAGEAVWFRASQLDKRLAWSNLAPIQEGPAPIPSPYLTPVKKKSETKRHHRGRAQQQETAARLLRMPGAVERSVYQHNAWWNQRAVRCRDRRARPGPSARGCRSAGARGDHRHDQPPHSHAEPEGPG